MLPQHDPLFMQAAADHEDRKKVEGAKKRKKKPSPRYWMKLQHFAQQNDKFSA